VTFVTVSRLSNEYCSCRKRSLDFREQTSPMQKHNLLELVEFGEDPFLPKILVDLPGYRLVLLNIRSGRVVSQPVDNATVTIYALTGRITIFRDENSVDMKAGEVLWSERNALDRIEAHEDSSLLVVAVRTDTLSEEELDLRAVEHFQRHPLVFQKFDELSVRESFVLINDHDPIPLHGQMEAMRPHQLTWEYIVRGPGIFRIRVRRIAPLTGSETSPTAKPHSLWGIRTTR
jgi:uncharacterized protein (DUF2249 family)